MKIFVVNPKQITNVNTEASASPVFQVCSYQGGKGVVFEAKDATTKQTQLFFFNGGASALPIQPPDSTREYPPLELKVASPSADSVDVPPLGKLRVPVSLFGSDVYSFFLSDGDLWVLYEGMAHRILAPKFAAVSDFTYFEPSPRTGDVPPPPENEDIDGLIIFNATIATTTHRSAVSVRGPRRGRLPDPPKTTPWIIRLKELRECLAKAH